MTQKEYTRIIELKEELLEISALIVLTDNKKNKQNMIDQGRSIAAELYQLTNDTKYKI